jgi:PAS domain S-box-containing protein
MEPVQNDVAVLRDLIEESPTPIALYTGRGMRIHIANKAMVYHTWGKDASVIGETLRDALPELDGQPFHQLLDDVFTTGIPYEATEDLVKLVVNGVLQTYYYNFTYKPLFDNEGKVWGILNTATNVTDLVLARKRADEAEAQLAFSLTAAEIGTWDLDLISRLITLDSRTQEFFGFQKDDIVPYEDALKCIHPDDRLLVDHAVNRALDPQSDGNYDIKYRTIGCDDGKLRWLHYKGKAYFDEQGNKPYRFSGIAMDISSQILANEKVDSAEQLAQLALENIDAGSYLIDLKTNAITYTPILARIITGNASKGLSREDLIDHVHPDDLQIRQRAYEKVLATGKLYYEARFVWDDGSVHWVRISGKYIFDEHKTPVNFAGVAQDISAEAEAKHEQQKLLWLIDNSSNYISLSTWDGQLTYLNKAGQQMMGFAGTEEAKRHQIEYLMPYEVDKLIHIVNPALLKDGRWAGKVMFRHFKTGEPIPIHATSLLLTDAITNEPLGRATVIRDLRPELRAREEQEKLIAIVDNSFDCISVVDKSGQLTYINAKGRELIGYPEETGLVPHVNEYFFQEDLIHNAQTSEIILTQGYFSGLQRYRHLNTGEVIHAYAHAMRLNDPITGEFAGISVVIRDLGPEMAAQKALIESEELFRGITTASPAALWMADAQGAITFVNQIWIDWTGQAFEENLGAGWLNAVDSEDLEMVTAKFADDFNARRFHESQFRLQHSSGTARWIVCTGNPQYNTEGEFKGYIGACVDITEQKQLQQQKDEFIGIASHELKTPVTSLKAYTQVLQAIFLREGDEKKAVMLGKMNNQVDRLTSLIGDLLDVTKIQSGRLQFNDDYFDFNQLIVDLVEDLQRTTHNHQIITELHPTGMVYADKDRIGQVITNLVTNAIKYSPGADKVIINTSIEYNEIRLCVQDFGIGISADKKDRVFEQFYRVSGDKQHTFPGLGLGLYISSEIIKREGGRIWVDSIVGKGSSFCFALPLNR